MRAWYRLVFPRTHFERRKRSGFLFVLPALLFFGSVYLVPLAQSVMYSFFRILPGGRASSSASTLREGVHRLVVLDGDG